MAHTGNVSHVDKLLSIKEPTYNTQKQRVSKGIKDWKRPTLAVVQEILQSSKKWKDRFIFNPKPNYIPLRFYRDNMPIILPAGLDYEHLKEKSKTDDVSIKESIIWYRSYNEYVRVDTPTWSDSRGAEELVNLFKNQKIAPLEVTLHSNCSIVDFWEYYILIHRRDDKEKKDRVILYLEQF